MLRNQKKVSVGGDVMQVFVGLNAIVLAQALLYEHVALGALSILSMLAMVIIRLLPQRRHEALDRAASGKHLENDQQDQLVRKPPAEIVSAPSGRVSGGSDWQAEGERARTKGKD